MVFRLTDNVTWDGQFLFVEALTPAGPVVCRVSRNAIHALRIYSDLIGREIYQERHNIVHKLAPFLKAKLSNAVPEEVHELFPWDVVD